MYKDLRNHVGEIIFFLLIFLSLSAISQVRRPDPREVEQKFDAVMQIINFAYVDSVNEPKIVEKAIIETLKDLDPHSMYISKKDLLRANEPLVGNFEGIGVQFEILKDTITIVHPIAGGPSEKLGIMAGDKIIKINDENVAGKKISNQFVFDRLRGKRGTKVNVSIYRHGHSDLIDYTIVRDKIPIYSVDAAYMIEPGIGYINLNKFSSTSMGEIETGINKLKAQGLKSLILDLRNNSGGLMNVAIDLADEFLPAGKLIVYTEGIHSSRADYASTEHGLFEQGKLVVMINENSASASEIVSGAVQDWDRGIILGRRSFGKGLVQRPFDLPDSSQIRLTTARYHTPSGRCIQKSYTQGADKYDMELNNRFKHGELINPDSIKFPDSLKYYTSRKRVVYGAGGIMPDVFTAWDSIPITDFYMDVRRKNIVNVLIGDYVDKNRQSLLSRYPDFKTFDKEYVVDSNMMNAFFDLVMKEGIKNNEKQFSLSEALIKTQIRSLIAEKLFDVTSSVAVLNEYDKEVQKAVEVIRNTSLFDKLKIQH